MPFVIDASVTAAWILPDEAHPLADECEKMLAVDYALVPTIWWFEVRNLLIMSERRKRLDRNATSQALKILSAYPIIQDELPDEVALLNLARAHALSVYDAAYLELAIRAKLPMATLDKRLAAATASEGVAPLIDK